MRQAMKWMLAAALACVMPVAALAQGTFPSKPIKIIVPNPPGGGSDVTARLLAEQLTKSLGQPVVVENKAGGNGAVAYSFLAGQEPDGHTIVAAISGVVQNPWLVKSLPYKLEQLAPVSQFTNIPIAFAVSSQLGVSTLQEFVALAKSRPGTLSFASYGTGSSAHGYGEILNRQAGINLLHVPYRGEQPAFTDLLGGAVSSMWGGPGFLSQQAQAGKVKILAVASAKRSVLLPDVPTFAEAGFPALAEAGWSGFFVPAKTPKPVIDRLSREIGALLRQPELAGKINQYMEPTPSTPEEFSSLVQRDHQRWGEIFKTIGLQPQ